MSVMVDILLRTCFRVTWIDSDSCNVPTSTSSMLKLSIEIVLSHRQDTSDPVVSYFDTSEEMGAPLCDQNTSQIHKYSVVEKVTALRSHMSLSRKPPPRFCPVCSSGDKKKKKEHVLSGPEPPESRDVSTAQSSGPRGGPTAVSQARGLWSVLRPVHPRVVL